MHHQLSLRTTPQPLFLSPAVTHTCLLSDSVLVAPGRARARPPFVAVRGQVRQGASDGAALDAGGEGRAAGRTERARPRLERAVRRRAVAHSQANQNVVAEQPHATQPQGAGGGSEAQEGKGVGRRRCQRGVAGTEGEWSSATSRAIATTVHEQLAGSFAIDALDRCRCSQHCALASRLVRLSTCSDSEQQHVQPVLEHACSTAAALLTAAVCCPSWSPDCRGSRRTARIVRRRIPVRSSARPVVTPGAVCDESHRPQCAALSFSVCSSHADDTTHCAVASNLAWPLGCSCGALRLAPTARRTPTRRIRDEFAFRSAVRLRLSFYKCTAVHHSRRC